jgi:hypothetical protein
MKSRLLGPPAGKLNVGKPSSSQLKALGQGVAVAVAEGVMGVLVRIGGLSVAEDVPVGFDTVRVANGVLGGSGWVRVANDVLVGSDKVAVRVGGPKVGNGVKRDDVDDNIGAGGLLIVGLTVSLAVSIDRAMAV